jgi:hypothetical protein
MLLSSVPGEQEWHICTLRVPHTAQCEQMLLELFLDPMLSR